MGLVQGTGRRILQGISHLGAQEVARITNVEIGARLAKELQLNAAIPGPTVGRWINGGHVPSLEILAALARILNVDPGWLAFGELSTARAPGVTIESQATEIVAAVQKAVRDEEATVLKSKGKMGRQDLRAQRPVSR